MPDVDLVATKDFSYATRRLKAGDSFTVSAGMARVLVGIGKAEQPRVPGKVAPPPVGLAARAATATPAKVPEAPRAVPAISTRTVDPLDRDGDGKRGGSKKGSTRRPRKSAAKKG